jgi:hypothetical protein
MDTKKEMLKQAAAVLRTQQVELREMREKLAREELAERVVQRLVENDVLLAEDVLKKLSELRDRPLEDLEVMEKAAELYHGNFFSGFGKLSDIPDGRGYDSLTSYLLSEGE